MGERTHHHETPPADSAARTLVFARNVGPAAASGFAIAILALLVLLVFTLISNWTGFPDGGDAPPANPPLRVLWLTVIDNPGLDQRLLLIVATMGAIGGCVHVTRSFAEFLGNRMLLWSWIWWYALRIPLASLTAIVVYLVFRVGLIPSGSESLSPYGVAAIAGLSGVFVDLAIDKLRDVFGALLAGESTEARAGTLRDALTSPLIEGVTPSFAEAGSEELIIRLEGSGFEPHADVLIDGRVLPGRPRVEPPHAVEFELPADRLQHESEFSIVVRNPGGAGRESNAQVFRIRPSAGTSALGGGGSPGRHG